MNSDGIKNKKRSSFSGIKIQNTNVTDLMKRQYHHNNQNNLFK